MTVIKNKSTAMGQEFWSHIESIAEQSRENRVDTGAHQTIATVVVAPPASVDVRCTDHHSLIEESHSPRTR